MKYMFIRCLFLMASLGLFLTFYSVKAQSTRQVFTYYELKGLLLKHKSTAESVLSMKRFKLAASKDKPESIIYSYKKESDTTQILIRVRKRDGLVSEVAWKEGSSTLGTLTHDAVHDGFVPVTGNSRYYNRFQQTALFVHYKLAEEKAVPCILRTVELNEF